MNKEHIIEYNYIFIDCYKAILQGYSEIIQNFYLRFCYKYGIIKLLNV
jgi:hypothetical protein